MTGKVLPIDVNYDTLSGLYAGTSISIRGTSLRTQTDANGNWTLDSVPASPLDTVDFAKPGFYSSQSSLTFSGAGVLYLNTTYIEQIPSEPIVMDSLTAYRPFVNANAMLNYGGHYSSTKFRQVAVWTSVAPDTSFVEAILNYATGGGFFGTGLYGTAQGDSVDGSGRGTMLKKGQVVRFKVATIYYGVHFGPFSNTLSVTIP